MEQRTPEILIVDDDNSTIELIRQALREAGYNGNLNLVVANSAEEAEDKMRGLDSLAGVIVDLNLPGQSGEVFVQDVRERGRRCGIVLMGGDTIHAGDYRFMQKPIDNNVLVGLVKKMLAMWDIRRETKEMLESTQLLKAELGRAGYGTR